MTNNLSRFHLLKQTSVFLASKQLDCFIFQGGENHCRVQLGQFKLTFLPPTTGSFWPSSSFEIQSWRHWNLPLRVGWSECYVRLLQLLYFLLFYSDIAMPSSLNANSKMPFHFSQKWRPMFNVNVKCSVASQAENDLPFCGKRFKNSTLWISINCCLFDLHEIQLLLIPPGSKRRQFTRRHGERETQI